MRDKIGGISNRNTKEIDWYWDIGFFQNLMWWWIGGKKFLPVEMAVIHRRTRHKTNACTETFIQYLFLRKFLTIPFLSQSQISKNLGNFSHRKIVVSYLRARIFPYFTRKNLEDFFFINRFGKELYKTFSKNIPKKYGAFRALIFSQNGALKE